MKERATYDQDVIDKWSSMISENKKEARAELFIYLGIFAAMAITPFWPYLIALVAFLTVCAVLHRITQMAVLLCPHCGKTPIPAFDRTSPREAEYCCHCHYWLKSPYPQVS